MSQPDINSRLALEYRWRPLDQRKNEFRLLELVGFTEKPGFLQAKICHARINTQLSYTALSYCWGTWARDSSLILDDVKVMITANLHEALSVLFRDGVRHLWVDALCIDQQNEDEKGSQVLRMATIFKQAAEVVIWLGPEEPYSGEVLKELEHEGKRDDIHPPWIQRFLTTDSHGASIWVDNFVDFLHRDYWRRLWVVQEIAVAAEIRIFWGRHSIDGSICERLFAKDLWAPVFYHTPWTNLPRVPEDPKKFWLEKVGNEFYGLPWTSFREFNYLLHLWEVRRLRRSRIPMSLLELLYEVRACEVTEPLDRVYAILGLAFDHSYFISEPDYGLSKHELSLAMTSSFIRATGSLDIILSKLSLGIGGQLSAEEKARYPSWCIPLVDFQSIWVESNQFSKNMQYLDGRASEWMNGSIRSMWSATDGSKICKNGWRIQRKKLEVSGLRLGAVETCTWFDSVVEARSSPERGLQLIESLCRLFFAYSPLYGERELSRHLLKGHLLSKNRRYNFSRDRKRTDTIRNMLEAIEGDAHPTAEQIKLFEAAVKANSKYEWSEVFDDLFSIGTDCFGLSSRRNCDGFEAWLLRGCSVPVVLQCKTSTDGTETLPEFWLIDTAIIDNALVCGTRRSVMEGEAWRTAPKEAFEQILLI